MPQSDGSSVVTTYVKAWTSGDLDTRYRIPGRRVSR